MLSPAQSNLYRLPFFISKASQDSVEKVIALSIEHIVRLNKELKKAKQ